jgi:hypothetical protein
VFRNGLLQQDLHSAIGLLTHNTAMNILPIADKLGKIGICSPVYAMLIHVFLMLPEQYLHRKNSDIFACGVNINSWDQFSKMEENHVTNVPGYIAHLCFVGNVLNNRIQRFATLVSGSIDLNQSRDHLLGTLPGNVHAVCLLPTTFDTTFEHICVPFAGGLIRNMKSRPTSCPTVGTFHQMIAPIGNLGSCLFKLGGMDTRVESTPSTVFYSADATLRSVQCHGNALGHFVSVKWKIVFKTYTFILITQLWI